MDDSQTENGMQEGAIEDAASESPAAESTQAETTVVESTVAVALPSNGSSPRKLAANRKNANKSTGPKTPTGKLISSWNSTRHGLLSKRLPLIYGQSKKQFSRLLASLKQDLEPVGTLEEVLVEKIAQEYWRLGAAASHEVEALSREKPFRDASIDKILRYQTTINRQLFQAMNQLERLQRLRQGDRVPAPINIQLSGDTATTSDEQHADQ
jgi:hypothetical protein